MKHTLLTSNKFQPIQWSGGTTRELYIFPPESSYQERNFHFRLSTATIEAETTEFTSLPGVSRKLMVLAGQLTIHHQDHHSILLQKFDVDSFKGDWKTTSIGRCTDFNLMTSDQTSGQLCAMEIEKGQTEKYHITTVCNWFFVYASVGSVSIRVNTKPLILQTGDLLVIQQPTLHQFEISGIEKSELTFVEITVGSGNP